MAIKDNTQGVLNEVDRRISRNLVTAALMVETSAKLLLVPGHGFITGTLKRSITHEPEVPKKEVHVGSNVTYAPYVELGTSKMSARPYLRPALETNMPAIRRLFRAK